LQAEGLQTVRSASAAPDRATYLLRPDLGRRLPDAESARLRALAASTDGGPVRSPRLLVIVGDGLSSLAVARQALPLLRAMRAMTPPGWPAPGSEGTPVVVTTQARVALGDDIGEALGAAQVLMLIGERPGLSSPDSLGAYLTAAPRRGRHDAQRNCISNIRPEGLSTERAAHKIWWHVLQAETLQATGVGLKDLSDQVVLPGLPLLSG
jgi:ethanolamine ammonia-lyase small subunit